MTIMFNPHDNFIIYNRDYVKNVYAQKQMQGTSVIAPKLDNVESSEDTYIISQPIANNENYYNNLAKDYLDGAITEEEFYSHLEDIYYSHGGWATEEVSLEERQEIFNRIAHEAYNGVLNYYMMQNREEWDSANATAASQINFYYNTDYHYAELEQRDKFIQGSNELASKLGLQGIEESLDKNITTVNGRMSVMLNCNAGQFASLDVPPPPGMKIMLSVKYEPYEAKVIADGKEYSTTIPFSYDDLKYEFSLADLLSDFDIPDKYMEFIENITVLNKAIARFDPNAKYYHVHPGIMDKIAQYQNNMYMFSRAEDLV